MKERTLSMIMITNDHEFKAALRSLDAKRQRLVAVRFVESVLPLCTDQRIPYVLQIAADSKATDITLAKALKTAKAAAIDCHTRYGSEGDWSKQASYFVARATVAALTPRCHLPNGVAWQAALNSRMAHTSQTIGSSGEGVGQESRNQYHILAGLLNA